jgi:hypothetical protein
MYCLLLHIFSLQKMGINMSQAFASVALRGKLTVVLDCALSINELSFRFLLSVVSRGESC